MPALQVKDCPTEVYEELRRCASRENRSISQQALTILEDYWGSGISQPTIDQALETGVAKNRTILRSASAFSNG